MTGVTGGAEIATGAGGFGVTGIGARGGLTATGAAGAMGAAGLGAGGAGDGTKRGAGGAAEAPGICNPQKLAEGSVNWSST